MLPKAISITRGTCLLRLFARMIGPIPPMGKSLLTCGAIADRPFHQQILLPDHRCAFSPFSHTTSAFSVGSSWRSACWGTSAKSPPRLKRRRVATPLARSPHPGWSLEAVGAGTTDGTAVSIGPPSGQSRQIWNLVPKSDNTYVIRPSYSTTLAMTAKTGTSVQWHADHAGNGGRPAGAIMGHPAKRRRHLRHTPPGCTGHGAGRFCWQKLRRGQAGYLAL